MKQLFCEYCNQPLTTAEEIVMGLCGRHIENIRSDDYLIGICWQCGSITHIQSRKAQRHIPIKDKYIFARGCQKCTGDSHDGIMWMTIKAESVPGSAVTLEGKIIPIEKEITDIARSV